MKVTMQDIADKAGVSKATVSRVINGDPYVSEDTRGQVMKYVKKYNYKPHTVARGLARDLSHTIGLMIPGPPRNITDPFFLEFLHGVGNTAATYNYSLSLPTIDESNEKKLYQKIIKAKQIDGLIVINPRVDDFRIDYLQAEGIPFVFLGRTLEERDICWVDGDNIGGACQATEYLLQQGHNQIACISGPKNFVASHLRLEGYKKAMQESDIGYDSELISRGDFTRDGGYSAMKELLTADISFTAVFVANDAMAMGAIQALKEANIQVPAECAVMGFDGIDLGTYVDPQLSTIRQPVYELGQEAVKTLLKLIQGDKIDQKQKILPVELLLRDSV